MPLTFRQHNNDSIAVLIKAATAIHPSARPVMRTMGSVFPLDRLAQVTLQQALPLYTIGTNAIADPALQLNTAKQTGWLYLFDSEMSAIVRMDPSSQQHQFSSFTKSSLPGAINGMIAQLHFDAAITAKQFEIRLLHFPALYTYTLWLKNETESTTDDLVVPVLTDQSSLSVGKVYVVAEFLGVLNKINTTHIEA